MCRPSITAGNQQRQAVEEAARGGRVSFHSMLRESLSQQAAPSAARLVFFGGLHDGVVHPCAICATVGVTRSSGFSRCRASATHR